jgi:nitrogen fixation/metabolism regulation signal transduction histidine kinase
MAFNNFRANVVARLVLLTGLIFVATWGAVATDWQVTPFVAAALAIVVVVELIRYVESVNRELSAFLEFVAHDDFSANLPVGRKGKAFERLGHAYAVLMDTYRKLNRERAANHRYLESLVEHVSTALVCFDSEGNIRLMNEQAQKLFDTPRLPSVRSLRRVDAALPERIEEMRDGDRALVNVKVGDEQLQLALFVTEFELLGEGYKLISFQNIRDELEQREADFSQKLIRVLTHEIMNSVTPIIALSKVIEDALLEEPGGSVRSPAEREDLLRSVSSIQSRGSGLVRFVQAYSSLTNLPRPKCRQVDVADLLKQVDALMAPVLRESGVELTTELDEPGLSVSADPEQIQQVLINLVKNANEALAGRSEGRVKLRASRDQHGGVTVHVIDNGPGIEEPHLGNIFVPFFTTKRSGTGVGLSISRQLMVLNKGLISVKTALGAGTEFVLKFR